MAADGSRDDPPPNRGLQRPSSAERESSPGRTCTHQHRAARELLLELLDGPSEREGRSAQDVELDDFVRGVRRGCVEVDLVRASTDLVPTLRDLLVRIGTLNADYTPNEAMAAALGWPLVAPESEVAARIER